MEPTRSTTTNSASRQPLLPQQNHAPTRPLEGRALGLIINGTIDEFRDFVAQTSPDIPGLRFNRRNCLHEALIYERTDIALFLLDPANGWAQSLVDHKDDWEMTPLHYAVTRPEHTGSELIDALLHATKDDLSKILAMCVVHEKHELFSDRLIAAKANPSYALARLYNKPVLPTMNGLGAVCFLSRYNIDHALMFKYAVANRLSRTIKLMTLLGHNWSERLTQAATKGDMNALRLLISTDIDYTQVLTRLIPACHGQPHPDTPSNRAVDCLINARKEMAKPPTGEKQALLWFAKCSMPGALQELAKREPLAPMLRLRDIAQCSVETIKALISVNALPDDALETLIRDGNVVQARKLVAAGAPTAALLEKLQAVHPYAHLNWPNVIAARLLILAGVDPERLNKDYLFEYQRLAQSVGKSDLTRGQAWIAEFPSNFNAPVKKLDVLAALLNEPTNTSHALARLRTLIELNRPLEAAALLKCGLNAGQALKAAVSATPPDWSMAESLIEAAAAICYTDEFTVAYRHANLGRDDALGRNTLQNQVLLELTLADQWDLVQKMVPRLTDGSWAVLDCVLRGDAVRAKQLDNAGADSCSAFVLALMTARYEAAATLMSWASHKANEMQQRILRSTLDSDLKALVQDAFMVSGIQITSILKDVISRGDEMTAAQLLRQRPEAGTYILEELTRGLPNDGKRATLQFLLKVGLDYKPIVTELSRDRKNPPNISRLQTLAALGLPHALDGLKRKIAKH
ncbi:hypothetical protein [Bordetella sp. 02P26C-1]|uniref:hypothetical protein n=1 Tax=Bordetella sp. 02P26C-1 TaxID=2683195 RepID=UPI001355E328|nr:hypothetical protein [Bordetella sp. 02P26C-1]MVW77518.1 hypothetical protein [Bordetella sp. 02P26C-1]